ncbi:helix-turn-helix domain-containing protein [Wukongibacter baidiensis]|uniref:helix-turn-helix domain-containing protein n=1 Tax=Wukongibacter baidiensis TaxID=1723361 RepID=UPI003D7F5659
MLNNRLQSLRQERKLKQNDMAKKLDMSQSGYSHYEQGIRIPDAVTLKKIADILDTTTDYLLGSTDIKDKGCNDVALTDDKTDNLADEILEIYIKKGKIKKGEKLTLEQREKILREIEIFIDMSDRLEGN